MRDKVPEIKTVSIVVPCFNEAETVAEFFRRTDTVASGLSPAVCEFVFVDDCSTDATGRILDELAGRDKRVKVLHLAGNRGHQIALLAGMDCASGDVIVTIDADLQDPPETIPRMLACIREGCDIVHAQRKRRRGEGTFKLVTAWLYYRLLRWLSKTPIIENCGDFRAFTRPVLAAVCAFRSATPFHRGTFVQIGFRQGVVPYDRDARFAGKTKYTLRRMVSLALDGVLGFSAAPIRGIVWTSIVLWVASLAYLCRALVQHFAFHITVPGWTSLVVLMCFFTGLILFSIAVVASYVGRIFLQVQARPLYVLSDARNVDIALAVRRATASPELRLAQTVIAPQPSSVSSAQTANSATPGNQQA
jgi:polyisoprenyl-phosphate glycosyltransferase